MTFAWYGHLKYRNTPLSKVIIDSWGIAFCEYCFQVPANRLGPYEFNGAQLKTIREVITLTVFSVFSTLSRRKIPMELRRRLCPYRARGILYLPSVVELVLASRNPPLQRRILSMLHPTGDMRLVKEIDSCNGKLPQFGKAT
jgi:uncharacterized protein (DUF486 family)